MAGEDQLADAIYGPGREIAQVAVAHPHGGDHTAAAFFILVFAVVAITLMYLSGRARRRDRLIKIALENNQPEVAQAIIGRRGGLWRRFAWAVLAVAILVYLDAPGIVYVALAGLALLYLVIGAERRARVMRKAAKKMGALEQWLEKKADENDSSCPPAGDIKAAEKHAES
jgi:hypothetical protein